MNAGRRKRDAELPPRSSMFLSFLPRGWRRVILGTVAAGLLLAGLVRAWDHWGAQITQNTEYRVLPENVETTPAPKWVRTDVKADVLRDGGINGLSLLDKQLTIRVAHAFSAHHWVEKVVRVSKHHPARLVVELVYRKPIAMVEVVTRGQSGLLPVDASGVLLPPADFSPDQTHEYLRIAADGAVPAGPVGTAWGDARIHGAARIAGLFQDSWKSLGLHRVVATNAPEPSARPAKTPDESSFDLLTRKGTRIHWGPAPAADNPAEIAAALKKVARLFAHVKMHGALDSETGMSQIDLRARPVEPFPGPQPAAQTPPESAAIPHAVGIGSFNRDPTGSASPTRSPLGRG